MDIRKEKESLLVEISKCEKRFYSAVLRGGYAKDYSDKLNELNGKLVYLNHLEAAAAHSKEVVARKMQNITHSVKGAVLQYKEVVINEEIFLECTSCSADKGNCSCWSID